MIEDNEQIAFATLPASLYPIKFEALNPATKEVVWSITVERPKGDKLSEVRIPPLRRMFGFEVHIRITYGNGKVSESTEQGLRRE